MNDIIYITSDGSGMTEDDLISWILSIYKSNNGQDCWSFDKEIGSQEDFICTEVYWILKSIFS
jgi:hypothetical protein